MSLAREAVIAAFERNAGNVSAAARSLGLHRTTVQHHLRKSNRRLKPLVGGTIRGVSAQGAVLPGKGKIKRYILTSAQNNTKLHDGVWDNILALAYHYKAELLVGTFSYNQNAYGKLAVKRGKHHRHDQELWYDERVLPYVCDERRELANGLVWCGEMNILPTASEPLEGLETYSSRKSGIFPHARLAMRSIATMLGEGTKFNYTTGTVTQRNYIQKRAGLVAEHHHSYGALLVEVNERGNWWVRQLDADEKGKIQDLSVLVEGGKVTTGQRIESITWGDIHATTIDKTVVSAAHEMLESLRPSFQFMHDILEGVWFSHHRAGNPHEKFKAFLRGLHDVQAEFNSTAAVLKSYHRPWAKMVVVDSNHDGAWLYRWLREHDYRHDPLNAVLFLELQLAVYRALRKQDPFFNITAVAMRQAGCPDIVQFLGRDESFKTCHNRIENGMHGHLGPDGARGTPQNLKKIGRRANTAHTHSAGIYDGLYVAGTSSTLDMGYNYGPSSWSHSHILTYPSGKRTIVTVFNGAWRA